MVVSQLDFSNILLSKKNICRIIKIPILGIISKPFICLLGLLLGVELKAVAIVNENVKTRW